MAIREILEVPDPRLKVVSEPVAADEFNDELKTLVEDMFETMYDAPGIGLAAIQVGVPKRVLVIDLQPEDPDAEPVECDHDHGHDGHKHTHQPTKKEPRTFINPVIVDPAEELSTYQEGCLSVPEIYADVDRPATCTVRYQDLDGNHHEEQMEGLVATCIQHEMDHLEGILFIDHLSRLKRQMALKKLKKIRQAA
ncbi:peptide deformylase [Altererythrobacter lutimaris]|uniref:Peptide deformylase n=1 Tax=Altererythrobacter lutimaris TaxID=2743979 RepID=A0A850HCI6_9SPHN|nr:peptide deformylase [Altererythrobacter lutimaris]NVE94646.1 peptide deformylase [Altererythrobacter lutimaris]